MYYLSLFMAPSSIIAHIEKIRRNSYKEVQIR